MVINNCITHINVLCSICLTQHFHLLNKNLLQLKICREILYINNDGKPSFNLLKRIVVKYIYIYIVCSDKGMKTGDSALTYLVYL